jgi:hypothetical protein
MFFREGIIDHPGLFTTFIPYDKFLTLSYRSFTVTYQAQKPGHGNAQAELSPLFSHTP